MKQHGNNTRFIGRFFKTLILCTLCAITANAGPNWQISKGTKANFSIDGVIGINVNGTLEIVSSTVVFDPANPKASTMDVTLSVNTMATGINKRDKHLKSDDFFAIGKYPNISFHATSVEKTGGNNYKVIGTLKIKAATKTVAIPFTFDQNGNSGTFKGDFNLNRVDYGIGTGKENGMGKEVRIKLEIPVKKG